uniref:Glycoside hydrolase n=2 Tax=Caenorhabditis tropicalis TaxID=1561998 RepID=A0A1I7T5V4_9PELO
MINSMISFIFLFSLTSARVIQSNPIGFETIEAKPAPEIVNNDASYGNAVDFSVPTSPAIMTCLKKAKYQTVFIRGFAPAGSGSFDMNCVGSIRNAYSAGLGIEVYMTPQPSSSYQGYQQLDILYNGLTNNGITVRSVWIQVTSPSNWPNNPTANVNFINSIVSRAKQYGLTVGIYTSQYDWSQITAQWNTLSSDVLLWYWNVLGSGSSGETKATFDDFRAFGSFKKASAKQYAQVETVCQMVVNRDVYAVGIPAAAAEKTSKTENGKIVVGGFVGN